MKYSFLVSLVAKHNHKNKLLNKDQNDGTFTKNAVYVCQSFYIKLKVTDADQLPTNHRMKSDLMREDTIHDTKRLSVSECSFSPDT